MKNKTVQRVLSFCLALLLCFTWNIAEPLVANAFAIELGWVTWALISFMAASGFTFAVAGGIDALKAQVDEKVDTYYQVKGIDLYQLIAQSLRFNNNNNGQPGFWFTIAAITAIREFLVWLKSDQLWEPGEEIAVSETRYCLTDEFTVWINGVETKVFLPVVEGSSQSFPYFAASSTKGKYKIIQEGTFFSLGDVVTTNSTSYNRFEFLAANNVRRSTDSGSSQSLTFEQAYKANGVSSSDIVGFTIGSYLNDEARILPVTSDGYVLFSSYNNSKMNLVYGDTIFKKVQTSYTITVPETIPEFDIDEDKYWEVSFDAFQGYEGTFTTPEELGEAVKQQIIDTGTVPSIKTEVVTDPDSDPQPSPVIPPPDQTDPDYPDIGELGLPSLGDALKSKFPFSLPWTFGAILGIFLAPRQTPKWEVDLPAPLSTSFTIDLSSYEELGYVSRWMSDIGFAIALLLATRKFIHW